MTLSYLDQNALLALGFKSQGAEFRKKVDAAIAAGTLSVVLSSWHLIETANTKNLQSAVRLADFMESLSPGWLFERRDLQKMDVQEDFFRFIKIEYKSEPRIASLSAIIAALHNEKNGPKFDIPPRVFVKQWIEHPDQLKVMLDAFQKNSESLIGLRRAVAEGKLTEEMRKRVDELLAKMSLPQTTPAGLDYGHDVRIDYAQSFKAQTTPTIAVESAISEHEWGSAAVGRTDRNTFIDKIHLISALPWVDEIVSTDAFFAKIHPVAVTSGFVKAKLVTSEDFLSRFE